MMEPSTLNQYQRDGAVALRGAVPLEWIARLREGVAQNLQSPGPHAKRYTPDGNPGHALR